MPCKSVLLVAALPLILASRVEAQDATWQVGLRLASVAPHERSSAVGLTRAHIVSTSQTVPALDARYRLSWSWAIELGLSSSEHKLHLHDGPLTGVQVGSVRVIPSTIIAQYRLDRFDPIFPYLGVGVAYTRVSCSRIADDMIRRGFTGIDVDDSFSFAAQAGADFFFSQLLYARIDAKFVRIGTDLKLWKSGAPGDPIRLDLDPWVIGAGIGVHF